MLLNTSLPVAKQVTQQCHWYYYLGHRQTLAYAYIIVDCAGFCTNIWVLQVVWPLLFAKSFRIPRSIMFYITILCFSDFFTLFGLVFVILDMIRGMWIFGEIGCNIYLLVEACNKFFPPFIVVLISRTCYKTICQGVIERKKASSINVRFKHFFKFLKFILCSTITDNITMTASYLLRCSFLPPPVAELFFDLVSFTVSYFIPLIGTIYYFASVPVFLRKRAENSLTWNSASEVTICKVISLVILLMAVYIICWTPYWLCRIGYKVLILLSVHITSLILHLLPYVSCTAYPLIFTLTNRRIKAAHAQLTAKNRHWPFLGFLNFERRARTLVSVSHFNQPSSNSIQKYKIKLTDRVVSNLELLSKYPCHLILFILKL
uniref:G_PROTEIN_RECEP_F1_2 domain-containing protein n=1 Tax=Syphacia muris TaxID=451379 RepID=A0A0N5AL27_9BILA